VVKHQKNAILDIFSIYLHLDRVAVHWMLISNWPSAADVLQWLSGNATKSLDVLAQYWQFLAQPKNPKSGDYGYSESEMVRFGADKGQRVYKALEKAADRKIKIR
jgi:hypothetical protein